MLEKIGLPPKPSLRVNNWVSDASHCQGCSSQFTFLNRKHHCRRCGGLFCNSCTSQRMILRGQGDSPVRICDPCKKLEDAARFELRHGRRSKTGKGSSKGASSNADEVLNQILVDDDKGSHPVQSSREINSEDGDMSIHGDAPSSGRSEMESSSPEELRQQSLEEKNNYKLLKADGKSAEALKAFKRAKELERQAAALELQLRKNRRKASASSSMSEALKMEDVSPEDGRRDKSISQKGKDKEDLSAELRELGWSDMDIHDRETKPVTTTLEGELLSLLGHNKKTSHNKPSSGLDKSQVVALKKKALMLKREGKLAEAKEELKRAKILEKQLEEQEFLADAEDSDDELSALIRSLDNDKQNDHSFDFNLDSTFDLSRLSGLGGDVGFDGNFEVTDYDMHDPEMAAALQSLGWSEEPVGHNDGVPQKTFVDREALADEILNLKKEAVKQKRCGNMSEAMSLLKKAKGLEKDLDGLDSVASHNEKAPEVSKMTNLDVKPPKSRLMIQKELLALKKKALALRREGKIDEADEELKKGKILEQQLEEMDTTSKTDTKINASSVVLEPEIKHIDLSTNLSPADEDGDVTDQDLHDPAYLSLLRNLGWQEEDNAPMLSSVDQDSKPMTEATVGNTDKLSTSVKVAKPRRSKTEIQRELLGLKRKALALRRQGNDAEAEEVLASAKGLEEQLAEMEMPKNEALSDFSEPKVDADSSKLKNPPEVTHTEKVVAQTPLKRSAEANGDDLEKRQAVSAITEESNPSPSVSPDGQKSPLQQEVLAHKRKALAFKREGKLAEARAELRKSKLLENSMAQDKPESTSGPSAMDVSSSARVEHDSSIPTLQKEQDPPHPAPKSLSSHERFKLQRECLSHKRNALKLRREGQTEEADAELELAKKLEWQLEEASPHDPGARASSEVGPTEDASVEDLFDPQLLSALKAIGLQDAHVAPPAPVKAEQPTSSSSNNTSAEERVQLESQMKAEKMKALNLKRAGKQKEALEALRRAKQMEKRLNSLTV